MRFCVLSLLVCAALTACSTPQMLGTEGLKVVAASELPPPSVTDVASEERPYRMGPFDRVAIDVFGIPELTKTVQADASGRISVPLIGEISAAGSTPAELSAAIAERLRGRYVRNPQVTVNLVDTVSQVVTIDGEVREPGLYPVVGKMTLMRAIARAKGTTEFSRQSHVAIFRQVQNQQMAALYDLKAIRNGNYADPEIFANDVIVVGESQTRRVFRDVVNASGLLTAPLIALVTR